MPRSPINAPEQWVPLDFPLGGIDLTTAYEKQRPGTTPVGINVRGWEPIGLRNRGGSRPGIVQYIPQQPSGSHVIQEINSLVVGSTFGAPFTTDLTGTVFTFSGNGGLPWILIIGSRTAATGGTSGDVPQSCGNDGTNFYAVTQLASAQRTPRLQKVNATTGASMFSVTLDRNQDTLFTATGALFPPPMISTNVYADSPGIGLYRLSATTGAAVTVSPWITTQCLGEFFGSFSWKEAGGVQGVVLDGTTLAIGMVKLVSGTYTYGCALFPLGTTSVLAADRFGGNVDTELDTSISGRTLDTGGSWAGDDGVFRLTGNHAVNYNLGATGGAGGDAIIADASTAAQTVMVTVNFDGHSLGDIGLVFRSSAIPGAGQPPLNYWYAFVDAITSQFRLIKVVVGVNTNPASGAAASSVTINNTHDYIIKVVCAGNNITATLDGGNTLSAVDAFNNAATRAGIANTIVEAAPANGGYYRDFNALANGSIIAVTSGLGTGTTFAAPWLLTNATSVYYCIPNGQVSSVSTAGAINWTQTAANAGHATAFSYYSNTPGLECTVGTGVGVELNPATGAVLGASPFGNTITHIANMAAGAVIESFPGSTVMYATAASKLGGPLWTGGSFNQTGSISALTSGSFNTYSATLDYQGQTILLCVVQGLVFVARGYAWYGTSLDVGVTNPPLSASVNVVRGAPNISKMWFVDGVNTGTRAWFNYYDPADNTVKKWTESTGNSLPADTVGNSPRLIETWRGRTVLSGALYQGNAIWMSAVGDPTNFNYAPASTTPTQAVALTAAGFGQVGDVVTCLFPYSDDLLIIFCDHQIWMMRGDPMAGGQLDLLSDSLGAAWGRSACKDPDGTVYFAGSRGGIYKMVPGQQAIRISQGIDPLLLMTSTATLEIRLVWDDQLQGVHVLMSDVRSSTSAVHYFWEQRTGAWWEQTFGNDNYNPVCAYLFYGGTPYDRVVLIGSWDGYVRSFQLDATTDDGTAISSSVILGPLVTKELDSIMLKDVQGVLDTLSEQATVSVYIGESAAAALGSTAIASFTWSAGRNLNNYVGRSAHAIYLKISTTNAWALEAIRLRISTQGKVARRAVYTSTPATGGVP